MNTKTVVKRYISLRRPCCYGVATHVAARNQKQWQYKWLTGPMAYGDAVEQADRIARSSWKDAHGRRIKQGDYLLSSETSQAYCVIDPTPYQIWIKLVDCEEEFPPFPVHNTRSMILCFPCTYCDKFCTEEEQITLVSAPHASVDTGNTLRVPVCLVCLREKETAQHG